MTRTSRAMSRIVLVIALATAALGCYPHYRVGHQPAVPAEPANVEALNSEADDMNAAAPPRLVETFPLVFSTNRFRTDGNRLAAFRIDPSYDVHWGTFRIHAQPISLSASGGRMELEPDLPQYGPVVVPADRPSAGAWDDVVGWQDPVRLVFTVATADAGLDLYVSRPFTLADLERPNAPTIASAPLAALNTKGDESYLAFGPGGTAVFGADGDLVSVGGVDSWETLLASSGRAARPTRCAPSSSPTGAQGRFAPPPSQWPKRSPTSTTSSSSSPAIAPVARAALTSTTSVCRATEAGGTEGPDRPTRSRRLRARTAP